MGRKMKMILVIVFIVLLVMLIADVMEGTS